MQRGVRACVIAVAMLVAGCGAPPQADGSAGGAASPTAAAPTATPSPTPTPEPREISIAMNGDLLWHNTLWFGAQEDARAEGRDGADDYDFAPLLAGVEPVISAADLAICHNEVPVAPAGGPYESYPTFASPPQTLDAVVATGYDMCTTASNHSLDGGFEGVARTLDAMDERGLAHVGTFRSEQEANEPVIVTVGDGVKVAVVTGTYGTNGIGLPEGKPWSVAELDADQMIQRAEAARAAGADIVLAAMHGGEEYQSEPNDQQVQTAEALTASGQFDLVYGHHVHVVQPITRVNDTWVAYGLGNLVAQHKTDVVRGYEGITTRFTFTEAGGAEGDAGRGFEVTGAEYYPTLVTHYSSGSPARTVLVNQALTGGDAPVSPERLDEAKNRTRDAVNLLGNNDGLSER